MENRKIIYKGFAVFNGKFDPKMFTNKKIIFPELPGYEKDREILMKFLNKTAFSPGLIDWTIIENSNKEKYDTKWREFYDECIKLRKEGHKVYVFKYASSHGLSVRNKKGFVTTIIVHSEVSENAKTLLELMQMHYELEKDMTEEELNKSQEGQLSFFMTHMISLFQDSALKLA